MLEKSIFRFLTPRITLSIRLCAVTISARLFSRNDEHQFLKFLKLKRIVFEIFFSIFFWRFELYSGNSVAYAKSHFPENVWNPLERLCSDVSDWAREVFGSLATEKRREEVGQFVLWPKLQHVVKNTISVFRVFCFAFHFGLIYNCLSTSYRSLGNKSQSTFLSHLRFR